MDLQHTRTAGQPTKARQFRAGDKVRIYDGLTCQNVWVKIDDVLLVNGRTKLRVAGVDFFFSVDLVTGHQKGKGRR